MQAKATEAIEKYMHQDGKSLAFPINAHHLRHWEQFWEPIILTIWDAKTNITYWECIQTFLDSYVGQQALKKKSKNMAVLVPSDNILDVNGVTRILARTQSRFLQYRQEQEGAKVLIDLLEEALGVKIEYDPQGGILALTKPNSETEYIVFGKLLAKLEQIQAVTGKEHDETIKRAVENAYELIFSQSDGSIIDKDSNGKEVRFDNMNEWLRDIET